MTSPPNSPQQSVPSVDRVLNMNSVAALTEIHGRAPVTEAVRAVIDESRAAIGTDGEAALAGLEEGALTKRIGVRLELAAAPSLKPVFNLTGTVLHTNLGRAPLPVEAIAAMTEVAGAANLEYDLGSGKRGDRDSHLEALLAELTGAEAATVVNNNAAAVLLTLNSLAMRKEVPVSRGELIEIGGAFRIPDIMSRAGAKLVEVGTTNRTHLKDYAEAVGPKTAALMKVHTSNYRVEGFTKSVSGKELAGLARQHDLPLIEDLGSGTLVDLAQFGLPHEPTAAETVAAGVDVVTFSGDKLLGGPQAGLIVGRRDLIERIKKNPMKRALRLDKVTIAALAAVLRLYRDPDRLAQRVPTLRLLARDEADIRAAAERMRGPVAAALGDGFEVSVIACQSQIGSGSQPVERLPSAAIAIQPAGKRKGAGLSRLGNAFQKLPVPVVGRIHDDALLFDLRCLEDEAGFLAQLGGLDLI
ncbi:MAG: L-seryl-tRNA(Sec) selenium transferase [Rhodospirillaceae bacterium]|jgi:L-seryl-tRNA(Ser) seleniumtransferase|nr:L-seryl-tRNA(Sec) selenium transferase [Rhodospirillaceae bacterium]MBT4720198.1 L-seryl-tRNA(Sec) selenium transferase [Rhodospirillaceae bacterium]MBT4749115.1 L-seryl-tRNA(Sec) selenium transferase [Rhodospirillaceae bacterium]MBT5838190.1 L-seryl-tRNA(Sec) selenium transferase [Rhodospirillaceae bacterium]MBT6861451.1 L-seryl-tRNA(Sec) selenium transferase [Rhodospirillaceae bacterium]